MLLNNTESLANSRWRCKAKAIYIPSAYISMIFFGAYIIIVVIIKYTVPWYTFIIAVSMRTLISFQD